MNIKKRIAVERRLVRHLIRVMDLAGWKISCIDDGGEFVKINSELEAMETVFSVDESRIYFKKGAQKHIVLIVLGNDGFDAIADYSTSVDDVDGFSAVMNKVSEYSDYLMMNECQN